MKELTIQEKAKAYDEALERAKEKYAMFEGMKQGDVLEDVFPELKESEDEINYNYALAACKYYGEAKGYTDTETHHKTNNWLKSIKERVGCEVNCTTTKEWSEEDERLCQCLIENQKEALDNVNNDKYGHSEIISDLKELYNERIDWLKSLKARYTWKPSEEQIIALR